MKLLKWGWKLRLENLLQENSSKTLTFFILVAGEVQKHGTISNTNALIL